MIKNEPSSLISSINWVIYEKREHSFIGWLLGYRDRLVITPSRRAARRPHLWRCLADVSERTADQHLLVLFWQITSVCQLTSAAADHGARPLLGIPILNRFDLLERLLESLDHPVETLALVDNSGKG